MGYFIPSWLANEKAAGIHQWDLRLANLGPFLYVGGQLSSQDLLRPIEGSNGLCSCRLSDVWCQHLVHKMVDPIAIPAELRTHQENNADVPSLPWADMGQFDILLPRYIH